MPLAQTMLPELEEELAATRRVLERVPWKPDWKPHPKSMTLGRLATLVAEMPQWATNALTRDDLDVPMPFVPTVLASTAAVVTHFDANAAAARAALAATPDAAWERPWTLKFGGHVAFTDSKRMVYRRGLNHLVHHRAQLGVYLRLNEVPVPAIYGPTADERG